MKALVNMIKQDKYTMDPWQSNLSQQLGKNVWKIMHNLSLIMLATDTVFTDQVNITLTKLHEKFQPQPLKIF